MVPLPLTREANRSAFLVIPHPSRLRRATFPSGKAFLESLRLFGDKLPKILLPLVKGGFYNINNKINVDIFEKWHYNLMLQGNFERREIRDEKNLSAQKTPQTESTRLPRKNGNQIRPQSSRSKKSKRQKTPQLLIDRRF